MIYKGVDINGKCVITCWRVHGRVKRIIHFISTVHKPTEVFLDRRNTRQIGYAPSLEFEVIQEYNRNMGGVFFLFVL